jgi:alkaline phosphatase D
VPPSIPLDRRSVLTSALAYAFVSCTTTRAEGPFTPVALPPLTQNAQGLKSVKRFIFGSCNKQYLPQPLWKNIIADKPDLFLWTGDVVYADTSDMAKLSQVYASQLAQAEFGRFLQTQTPTIGVWDDHDYGENNGSSSYPKKKESQKLFLDFIAEPVDSSRRSQAGIYTKYSFGEGADALRFILLDTRAERINATAGKPGDMLGPRQWAWLEKELAADVGGVTFIVSSIQVIPFEQKFEKWQNFPESRTRLLDLIERSPSKNIVIISGDRHFAELTRLTTKTGKDIWEVTSSGMTHAFRNHDDLRNHNSLRIGPILDRLNYGLMDFDVEKKTLTIEVRDLNRTAVIHQEVEIR